MHLSKWDICIVNYCEFWPSLPDTCPRPSLPQINNFVICLLIAHWWKLDKPSNIVLCTTTNALFQHSRPHCHVFHFWKFGCLYILLFLVETNHFCTYYENSSCNAQRLAIILQIMMCLPWHFDKHTQTIKLLPKGNEYSTVVYFSLTP